MVKMNSNKIKKITSAFLAVCMVLTVTFGDVGKNIGIKEVESAGGPTPVASGALSFDRFDTLTYLQSAVEGENCSCVLAYNEAEGVDELTYQRITDADTGTMETVHEYISEGEVIKVYNSNVTLYVVDNRTAVIDNHGYTYVLGDNKIGSNSGYMEVYSSLSGEFSNGGELHLMPGCDCEGVTEFSGVGSLYADSVTIDSRFSNGNNYEIYADDVTMEKGTTINGGSIHATKSLTMSGFSYGDSYGPAIHVNSDTIITTSNYTFNLSVDDIGENKRIEGEFYDGKAVSWLLKEEPSIDVDDSISVLYGTNYDLSNYMTTNSDGTVSMKYARYYGGDYYGEATTERPTDVGMYRVYYSVAETEDYRGIEDYDADYDIRYLTKDIDPNMSATTTGTYIEYDSDRYYSTPVTVTANTGFQIKNDDIFDEDGDEEPFSDSVTIDEDGYHYGVLVVFCRNSDLAKSQPEYVNTLTYYIDTKAPEAIAESVIDEKGNTPDVQVKDGAEFHARRLEFDIQDVWDSEEDIYMDALTSVTVNGEGVDIVDGIAHIEMSTTRGVKTYEIVAEDRAGNKNNMTLSIEYVKDVPETTISMADAKYGSALAAPEVETNSDQDESQYVYYYKEKGADDDSYTTTKPSSVGDYTVKVEIPATELYSASTATTDFSISYLAAPEESYSIAGTKGKNDYYTSDVYLNAPEGYTIATSEDGTFAESILYTDSVSNVYLKRTTDGAITDAIDVPVLYIDKDKPLIADRALDSDGYELELLEGNAMKAKSLSFTVQDINLSSVTVNGEAVDVADGNADINIKATVGEKVAYKVVAEDIAGNESNLSFTLEYGVKIVPTATVSLGDYYVGQSYEPALKTDSDGAGDAVFEYKKAGTADNSYTTSVPVTDGRYVVRATVPETENYKGISCTDEFELSFLEAPKVAFSLSGTKGKNEYYTSDVYLEAVDGYSIAYSLTGAYSSSVAYTGAGQSVYLRRASDGAKTDAIKVAQNLKIDKVAPEFLQGTDGSSVYSDEMSITVKDDHMSSLTVDGEKVGSAGTSKEEATAKLDPENGIKTFKMVAEDEAGNTSSLTMTLKATWLKAKVIPADKLLPLVRSESYKLDNGKWTVSGDSTVYSGGWDVYVNTDGSYTFTKQN